MTANVAINGRCLARRITGVERYAHEISKRLQPNPRIVAPKKSLGQLSGHLWEQIILPFKIHNAEILWSPANTGPWMIRNQVITIHDTSIFDHAEWFHRSYIAWTRLSMRVLAKQVKIIVTVSNFSRERIIHYLQVPEEKIHVIPNGVGKPFEPQTKNTIDETKNKYKLSKNYFLFVGTQEPRKNLTRLFEAWENAQRALTGFNLVIAGGTGAVFRGTGFQHIPDRTEFLGYVPTEDLPMLYAGSIAVVLPSLYEGFCIPAIEAMACGAPVITSNTSSLPEVTGGAALLINPLKSEEIARSMQTIVDDKSLADNLRSRGLHRASQFTWENSANQIQTVLGGV